MTTKKITTNLVICDGCGSEQIAYPDNEINGYYLQSVFCISPSGGDGFKNGFACSEECIVQAIRNKFVAERSNPE